MNVRYQVAMDFSDLALLQDREEVKKLLLKHKNAVVTFVWERYGVMKELSIDTREAAGDEERYARTVIEQTGGFKIAKISSVKELKKEEAVTK